MMPFNYTFRQMLLKHIRPLNDEKIDLLERKLARQLKLRHEKSIIPSFCLDFFNFLKREIRPQKPSFGPPFITITPKAEERLYFWLPKFEFQYQKLINDQISNEFKDAADLFEPYQKSYNALNRLWVAQREYAFAQGDLFQIPTNFSEFIKKAINYRKVQISTFWWRWKYVFYFRNKAVKKEVKLNQKPQDECNEQKIQKV